MAMTPAAVRPGALRIALAIFHLAPLGGREQQCLALARELAGRGHAVSLVFTGDAPALPPGVEAVTLPRRGRTSHQIMSAFAEDARRAIAGRFDRTVSFHVLPGFDVIFCTDPARAAQPWWRQPLPRYRTYAALQTAAFADPGCLVLALSGAQVAAYAAQHPVVPERVAVLPPAVDPGRRDHAAAPRPARPGAEAVWLWVGLQPKVKGLDRAIAALAAMPGARLAVCGLTRDDDKAAAVLRAAERLGVANRIDWKGFVGGEVLLRQIAAADLLIHPARGDITGNVILEALINGLPAVVTEVCGFSEHVARSGAGVVLPEPFSQADLDRAVSAAPETRAAWSRAALAYAVDADLYGGVARAADLIEAWRPSAAHAA